MLSRLANFETSKHRYDILHIFVFLSVAEKFKWLIQSMQSEVAFFFYENFDFDFEVQRGSGFGTISYQKVG